MTRTLRTTMDVHGVHHSQPCYQRCCRPKRPIFFTAYLWTSMPYLATRFPACLDRRVRTPIEALQGSTAVQFDRT